MRNVGANVVDAIVGAREAKGAFASFEDFLDKVPAVVCTTEMALREKLPEKYWIRINGLLVAFGQSICRPVAPHCDACPLADLCPRLYRLRFYI